MISLDPKTEKYTAYFKRMITSRTQSSAKLIFDEESQMFYSNEFDPRVEIYGHPNLPKFNCKLSVISKSSKKIADSNSS